jgi:large subunit ribosomal protein L28
LGKACAICGKTVQFGNLVSHSKRKTRVKKNPNLHRIKAMVNGEVKRIYVCSKCLKAGKVEKVV